MIRVLILFLLLCAAPAIAWASEAPVRPDPALTPGAVRPGIGVAEICERGYATRARHVTRAMRARVFAEYGMRGNRTGYCAAPQGCELDHLVALELGGSNAIANLWPQPYDGVWNAHAKNRLANRLHRMVCAGDLDLGEAQRAVAGDWIAAWGRYMGGAPPRN